MTSIDLQSLEEPITIGFANLRSQAAIAKETSP